MSRAYAPVPGVIETDLEQELVLLDPRTQQMFSLNDTGRRVWRTLPVDHEEPLVHAVLEAYEISREQAEADVRRLLAELLEAGLIEARTEG